MPLHRLVTLVIIVLAPAADAFNKICGTPAQPLNETTANVLIIGDSISMGRTGYSENVREMLEDGSGGQGPLATVQHAGGWGGGGQAASTARGIECVDGYLSGPNQTAPLPWDVISANFGLHDCDQPERVEPAQYEANLRTILGKAQAAVAQTNGTVIFVTSTPFDVADSGKLAGINYTCVLQYNAIAQEVAGDLDIPLADLFTYVDAFCGANYTSCAVQLPDNLHFFTTPPNPSGQQYTALSVASAIAQHLPEAKIQNRSWVSAPGAAPPAFGAVTGCGVAPSPLSTSVPNVLLIGDSVSMTTSGYGPDARALLEKTGTAANPEDDGPIASVQHCGGWCSLDPEKGCNEQASSSANGRRCIDFWLGGGALKWDVIHWNFGIHDCWAPQRVNASQYVKNLQYMVGRMRGALAPGGKIVWATTTPIQANCSAPPLDGPPQANPAYGPCYGVPPACVRQYNALAAEAFAGQPDIVTDDLYAAVNAVCGAGFHRCTLQRWHDVHPTQAGKQFLAIAVAHSIAPLLGPAWRAAKMETTG